MAEFRVPFTIEGWIIIEGDDEEDARLAFDDEYRLAPGVLVTFAQRANVYQDGWIREYATPA